jgi:hypothetical protein
MATPKPKVAQKIEEVRTLHPTRRDVVGLKAAWHRASMWWRRDTKRTERVGLFGLMGCPGRTGRMYSPPLFGAPQTRPRPTKGRGVSGRAS